MLPALLPVLLAAALPAPLDCERRPTGDDRAPLTFVCKDPKGAVVEGLRNEHDDGFAGVVRTYDAAGQVVQIGRYRSAKPHGAQETFFPDGSPKFKETYRDGVLEGPTESHSKPGRLDDEGKPATVEAWEKGVLRSRKVFEKGRLKQSQEFFDDGSIKSEKTEAAGTDT